MDFTPDTEGIFLDLPAEVYRSAPGIAQSCLKEFGQYATPLHYLKRKPKEATADMEFGTVAHASALTPDKFSESYHLRPETYPVRKRAEQSDDECVHKPWHGGADYCKKWLAEHSDRPVLTSEQLANIHRIAEGLTLTNTKLVEFQSALANGQTEVSYFKRDEVTGLMLKCRPDLVATESDGVTWLFDIKKVQSGEATHNAFSKQAFDLGYDVQCASYLYITGATRFVFVPFDDSEPFDACQFEPDNQMIQVGMLRWRSLLTRYAECVKTNTWPGYAGGLQDLTLPAYAKKGLE